jgi:hypothetical protein
MKRKSLAALLFPKGNPLALYFGCSRGSVRGAPSGAGAAQALRAAWAPFRGWGSTDCK